MNDFTFKCNAHSAKRQNGHLPVSMKDTGSATVIRETEVPMIERASFANIKRKASVR